MNSQQKKSLKILLNISILSALIFASLPFKVEADSSVPENMILINAGGFMRGMDKDPGNNKSPSSKKAFEDEGPARMVYLSSYYIDKYEVSNSQYKDFMRATDHATPAYWDHRQLNIAIHPVTGVNWHDASAYCRWNKKRLPTEAEWEKAARGPAGLIYPWGNIIDIKKANFSKGNTGKKMVTTPIDSYPEGKSYYGVHNMAGNVFEWVQDWYDPDYYKDEMSTVRNAKGPNLGPEIGIEGKYEVKLRYGQKKVIRGGSWFAPAESITTTHRFWNDPMNNSYGVGLGIRCARDIKDNSRMEARSYYMDALVEMGNQKHKQAFESIKRAFKISPADRKYKALKEIIKKRGNL